MQILFYYYYFIIIYIFLCVHHEKLQSGKWTVSLDNSPADISPLTCSVRVRIRVRFRVWVMGNVREEEMFWGKCTTLHTSSILPRLLSLPLFFLSHFFPLCPPLSVLSRFSVLFVRPSTFPILCPTFHCTRTRPALPKLGWTKPEQ